MPTKNDKPPLLQSPPLIKVAKTDFAEPCGPRYTNGIRIAKNPIIWKARNTPSTLGSHLAKNVFIKTIPARKA
jgi:hypothetical protein